MTTNSLQMSPALIARTVGTVGSPLIVVSELIKNAVDAAASQIDIFYDVDNKAITIQNDNKGFSLNEILGLSQPGNSEKKMENNLKNDKGMYLTGSKGLGLLSVFLLCNDAEIETVLENDKLCIVKLDKTAGTIGYEILDETSESKYTKVTLFDVNPETIEFLRSESEVKKLRHICTYLYKSSIVPFPKMFLHIGNEEPAEINFSCEFPDMMYDVNFHYNKQTGQLEFQCISPKKSINNGKVFFSDFSLPSLEKTMLDAYGIAETIPTRTNEFVFTDFKGVPSFEGRILVYERSLAGEQLKTYGAGVNIYINDYALYNYLAEENDWLGLADYSQRKKVTRLKPHNVFGYVNFPEFDENTEPLQISNERADFIQDLTFQKLMYIIKGVVLFSVLNIDVADKNPKYKVQNAGTAYNSTSAKEEGDADKNKERKSSEEYNYTEHEERESNATTQDENDSAHESDEYHPVSAYKPKPNIKKCLQFSGTEGKSIELLKGTDNLGDKIYNLVYELSKLDLQDHRYAVACLYRSLLESATKKAANKTTAIVIDKNNLEASVNSALNYFGNQCGKNALLSDKVIKACRDSVKRQKIIDILNEYIHNETVPDAFKIQETWNTMKEYVLMCLSI